MWRDNLRESYLAYPIPNYTTLIILKKYPIVLHNALFLGYFRLNLINTKEKKMSYNIVYVALSS